MNAKDKDEITDTLLMMFLLFAFVCYLASFSFPVKAVMMVAGIGEAIIAVLLAYVVIFAEPTSDNGNTEDCDRS